MIRVKKIVMLIMAIFIVLLLIRGGLLEGNYSAERVVMGLVLALLCLYHCFKKDVST